VHARRRRLAEEIGTVVKDAPRRVALVYPSPYRVGMSALGFQQVYRLLNARPDVTAERAFLRDPGTRVAGTLSTYESGRPVGDHPLDATILAPDFDPATAAPEAAARHAEIENALDAFSQAVATVAAHETGHMLGLVAHGPAPGGLWGGSAGGKADHNVTTSGGTPSQNHMMNAGGSFTFDELTGRGGEPLPAFRPLNWAYLRDRVVLDDKVTGLFPAPTVTAVAPDPLPVPPGGSAQVVVTGTGFLPTPATRLLIEGDPTPNALLNEELVNGNTVRATVNAVLVPPGLYDLELTNADGQVVVMPDFLEVQ